MDESQIVVLGEAPPAEFNGGNDGRGGGGKRGAGGGDEDTGGGGGVSPRKRQRTAVQNAAEPEICSEAPGGAAPAPKIELAPKIEMAPKIDLDDPDGDRELVTYDAMMGEGDSLFD